MNYAIAPYKVKYIFVQNFIDAPQLGTVSIPQDQNGLHLIQIDTNMYRCCELVQS